MKFSELSVFLDKLEKTSSRNEIASILSDLFVRSTSDEIDKITYLSSGKLAPNYKGIEFNIADKIMLLSISRAFNISKEEVVGLYKNKGDLGEVAQALSKKKESETSILSVYGEMLKIAAEGGGGSQERKIAGFAKLMSSLDSLSNRFVARIPVGKLRLGFSDMTILDALSLLIGGDKSKRIQIEAAFNVTADIGKIARLIKEKGLKGVANIVPEPGTPIRSSLAERLPSAEKMLEKVGREVYVEPKYDGFRAQVHIWKEGGETKVAIFSRNMESTTHMFPDLVAAAKKVNVDSVIFDGEAIGYDPESKKFLPFQETVQRKRKHEIEEAIEKNPLKLFVFDILYKNGENLMSLPFYQRRKILEETIGTNEKIEVTRQEKVSSAKIIRDLIQKYLSEGLEGALIKKIDATYKPGARGYHWVKYKKTTVEGVADTIDCLVMGTYRGKGKRTGFGAGAFLVGVLDRRGFKTVSKIGTGLTDDQWREMYDRTNKILISQKPEEYLVDKNLDPDTWVKPELVVEILADEITRSPIHSAGLALRFPRLVRFRDDKNAADATTLKELENLYENQKIF